MTLNDTLGLLRQGHDLAEVLRLMDDKASVEQHLTDGAENVVRLSDYRKRFRNWKPKD